MMLLAMRKIWTVTIQKKYAVYLFFKIKTVYVTR